MQNTYAVSRIEPTAPDVCIRIVSAVDVGPDAVSSKHTPSKPGTFEGRIAAERARAEQAAAKLPKGPQKDALLKKIDQLDKAIRMYGRLSSSGLQSPK
jgi:hypothetical protein